MAMRFCLVILLLLVNISLVATIVSGIQSEDKYQIIRLFGSKVNISTLTPTIESINSKSLYPWYPEEFDSNLWEIIVPASATELLVSVIKRSGLKWMMVESDLEKHLAAQPIAVKSSRQRRRSHTEEPSFINLLTYHSFESMEQYFLQLNASYPDLVRLERIGTSFGGRALYVLKRFVLFYLGSGADDSSKPAIWIDGGIHGREWAASHSVLYYIRRLLSEYKSRRRLDRLDKLDWFIAPMMNPDGYTYTVEGSKTSKRFWRKNRSGVSCRSSDIIRSLTNRFDRRICCRGVDLNRNFDFNWSGPGDSSSDPCTHMYHGPVAFSEKETKAVYDFLTPERLRRIKASISVHSYAQLWLHPFGDKKGSYPSDIRDVRSLADRVVQRIRDTHGVQYWTGNGADRFYEAPGTSSDWLKNRGVKYAYTVELRPKRSGLSGFLMDTNETLLAAEETFNGIDVVADKVVEEFTEENN